MTGPIKLNQAGYTPGEKKVFIYSYLPGGKESGSSFHILDREGKQVFRGDLEDAVPDKDSGDMVSRGDFSGLREPGRYTIASGGKKSHPFEISDNKYHDILYTSMRSYFLQRCGMEINDPVSGVKHAACHLNDSFSDGLPQGTGYTDTAGGWHDAGDYGKYMATAAISVYEILMMYNINPGSFEKFSLDIPLSERAAALPDILSEIKYELDWMLKMQDKSDGGVYHKVNTLCFSPIDTAPEDDLSARFHYSKGTADTAYFAGALAFAAGVFRPYDPDYAMELKKASLLAGDFLIRTDGTLLEPTNGMTGTYKIRNVAEGLCWAYAQLYRLTNVRQYLDMFLKTWKGPLYPIVDWNNVSLPAVYALLHCPGVPEDLSKNWIYGISATAEKISSRISANGYRTALVWEEYEWPSIKTALSYGMALVLASEFTEVKDIIDNLKHQLDYTLGVNPMGKSYVTCIGTDYVKHPHHRLAVSKNIPVPGLLVGGPNNRVQVGTYNGDLGPKSYADETRNASCNEPAINYNSPLVFIAGYLYSLPESHDEDS
ncbi:MAG: glycoside hydrolase family 9 protein [Brevinematales bacterium]|jgi:endoglucanase